MLFVEVVRPMAAPRDERRPGVPVHTPFLPQYLPAMILVYRRVLYEQWQPREMKEGRVFLRHGRSWRRGGARDKNTALRRLRLLGLGSAASGPEPRPNTFSPAVSGCANSA